MGGSSPKSGASTARQNATGSPAASERATAEEQEARWSRREIWALAGAFVLGIAIRVVLLPTRGLPDDVDQFVGWVHIIATKGLGGIYDEKVTFGPVMPYIWGLLAALDPVFKTVTNGSDPAVSAAIKLPASIADLGMAALIAYALRARPGWAVVGASVILLHPAVIDLSAWWGQYESIYLLSALAGVVLAIEGRLGWAAAAVALSLMTKPQAVPLLIPFAAWFWATGGWRGVIKASAIGVAVIVVLWLPFLAAGGPANYLRNLGEYQGEIFNYLSLRAWNLWWLVQEGFAGGGFIRDDNAVLGPVTLRHVGYAFAVLLDLAIGLVIIRRPGLRTLALGLAASVLVFFSLATQMHERYAYGALVFLALVLAEPAARWLAFAFGVVFTLNLLAAIPPTPQIGSLLPVSGALGIAGSIAMLAITYAALRMLGAVRPDRGAAGAPPTP
jgi:Gpi18-like mannosyltransferase